jgi:hypothetical protein
MEDVADWPSEKAGEGRVPAIQPMIFSADETTDIGEARPG